MLSSVFLVVLRSLLSPLLLKALLPMTRNQIYILFVGLLNTIKAKPGSRGLCFPNGVDLVTDLHLPNPKSHVANYNC